VSSIGPRTSGYTLFLRVTDEGNRALYIVEHSFAELPEPEAVLSLFESAKRSYALVYPEAEPIDFSVELRLARPSDATIKR